MSLRRMWCLQLWSYCCLGDKKQGSARVLIFIHQTSKEPCCAYGTLQGGGGVAQTSRPVPAVGAKVLLSTGQLLEGGLECSVHPLLPQML